MKIKFTLLLTVLCSCFFVVKAQIILNTTIASTGYTGTNSSGTGSFITFVITNTNSYPVNLNSVGNWTDITDNNTTSTLWYSTTSLSGHVTLAGPTWITIQSSLVSGITSAALSVNTVISNISFVIPANTTYRFALFTTGNNRYSGTGAGTCTPNTFTSGGVSLRVGDVQISGQNVGYGGPNNPRFFTGLVNL
jgi:hypothetical protein